MLCCGQAWSLSIAGLQRFHPISTASLTQYPQNNPTGEAQGDMGPTKKLRLRAGGLDPPATPLGRYGARCAIF